MANKNEIDKRGGHIGCGSCKGKQNSKGMWADKGLLGRRKMGIRGEIPAEGLNHIV